MVTIRKYPFIALMLTSAVTTVKGNVLQEKCFAQSSTLGDLDKSSGTLKEVKSIRFDVESNLGEDKHVVVEKFSLRIGKKGNHTVKVLTREGTHVGNAQNESSWKDLGEFHVEHKRNEKEITIALDPSNRLVLPPKGVRQSFYLLHVNDNKIHALGYNISEGDVELSNNGDLITYLGIAEDGQNATLNAGRSNKGVGFWGSFYYQVCGEGEANNPNETTGHESNSSNNSNASVVVFENDRSRTQIDINASSFLGDGASGAFHSFRVVEESTLDATKTSVCDARSLVTAETLDAQGEITKVRGIMFDVESNVDNDKEIVIEKLSLHIEKKEKHSLQVYAKNGTHVDHVRNKDEWTNLGSYDVDGMGKAAETILILDPSNRLVLTRKNNVQALFILQRNKSNIQVFERTTEGDVGAELNRDDNLIVRVGTGRKISNSKELSEETSFRAGSFQQGRCFHGRIQYRICDTNIASAANPNVNILVEGGAVHKANATEDWRGNMTIPVPEMESNSTFILGGDNSFQLEGSLQDVAVLGDFESNVPNSGKVVGSDRQAHNGNETINIPETNGTLTNKFGNQDFEAKVTMVPPKKNKVTDIPAKENTTDSIEHDEPEINVNTKHHDGNHGFQTAINGTNLETNGNKSNGKLKKVDSPTAPTAKEFMNSRNTTTEEEIKQVNGTQRPLNSTNLKAESEIEAKETSETSPTSATVGKIDSEEEKTIPTGNIRGKVDSNGGHTEIPTSTSTEDETENTQLPVPMIPFLKYGWQLAQLICRKVHGSC